MCLKAERTVRRDNCVSYQGKILQIPKIRGRCHYVKAAVQVHEYSDGRMAIFHGPRKLARYEASGALVAQAAGQAVGDAA